MSHFLVYKSNLILPNTWWYSLFVRHWCFLFRFIIVMNCSSSRCIIWGRMICWLFKSIYFTFVAPKFITLRILFFNKIIVCYVCCKKCILLVLIWAFCNLTKAWSKFILWVFARNITTVAWDLRTGICNLHKSL